MSAASGPLERTHRSTLLALAALVVVLTVVAGPFGALAGVATAAVRYALGTPYAVAAGHVSLPSLFPAGIEPPAFVAVELAFLAVVVAPAAGTSRPLEFAAVVLAGTLALGGVAWLALRGGSLLLAAAALLAVGSLAAYTIDLYERYRLGPDLERRGDSSPKRADA